MNRSQSGETLIEIIIVLLLLSLAVTGLSGTMLKAQQLSQISIQKSTVSFLLASLASHMRSNARYAIQLNNNYLITLTEQSSVNLICPLNRWCNSAALATRHVSTLQRQLMESIPVFQLIICRDSSPWDGNKYDNPQCDHKISSPIAIKLWWQIKGIDERLHLGVAL